MPEAELSLVFLQPLNRLGLRYIRSMLKVSGEQIDRAALGEWIRVQGVGKKWKKVNA